MARTVTVVHRTAEPAVRTRCVMPSLAKTVRLVRQTARVHLVKFVAPAVLAQLPVKKVLAHPLHPLHPPLNIVAQRANASAVVLLVGAGKKAVPLMRCLLPACAGIVL